MLGNFACLLSLAAVFFLLQNGGFYSKKYFRNTIRVSYRLVPNVGPEPGSNLFAKMSAADYF